MNNAGIKIVTDTLNRSIEEVLKVMSRAESSALRAGASVIRKQARANAKTIGVKVMARSSKYNDRLIDAIRASKVKDGSIVVHTMGTRAKMSGTYRMRFFEGGTKERLQKSVKGRALSHPRRLGKIDPHPFFEPAVRQTPQRVLQAMDEKLRATIERAWNNNK